MSNQYPGQPGLPGQPGPNPYGQPAGPQDGGANSYGQPNTPYGQPNTPTNQPNTPYGQPNTPTNQPNIPYGQPNTPTNQPNTPYGQPNTPTNQPNTPYGQSPAPMSMPYGPAPQPGGMTAPSGQPPYPSVTPTKKGINPLFIILPITLALVLIGGVLAFFLTRPKADPTPTPSLTTPQTTVAPSSTRPQSTTPTTSKPASSTAKRSTSSPGWYLSVGDCATLKKTSQGVTINRINCAQTATQVGYKVATVMPYTPDTTKCDPGYVLFYDDAVTKMATCLMPIMQPNKCYTENSGGGSLVDAECTATGAFRITRKGDDKIVCESGEAALTYPKEKVGYCMKMQ